MLITDKPEELEARAAELDAQVGIALKAGQPRTADHYRERAVELRKRAVELRKPPPGVRFG